MRDTATKPDADPALGAARVAELAALTGLPSVTIGGVLPDDLPCCADSGLAGVAVVFRDLRRSRPGVAARAYLDRWTSEVAA